MIERVTRVGRKLSQKDIEKIVEAHKNYGSASQASKELPYSVGTIIHYWREADLEIRRYGRPEGFDIERHNHIVEGLKNGKNRAEIARELGISRQAVSAYCVYRNIGETRSAKRGYIHDPEKYNQIKNLLKKGLTQSAIARELGYSSNAGVLRQMERHSELRRIYEKRRGEK